MLGFKPLSFDLSDFLRYGYAAFIGNPHFATFVSAMKMDNSSNWAGDARNNKWHLQLKLKSMRASSSIL